MGAPMSLSKKEILQRMLDVNCTKEQIEWVLKGKVELSSIRTVTITFGRSVNAQKAKLFNHQVPKVFPGDKQ
jgi:hypothetical protein